MNFREDEIGRTNCFTDVVIQISPKEGSFKGGAYSKLGRIQRWDVFRGGAYSKVKDYWRD